MQEEMDYAVQLENEARALSGIGQVSNFD